jgi:hypothetical protein
MLKLKCSEEKVQGLIKEILKLNLLKLSYSTWKFNRIKVDYCDDGDYDSTAISNVDAMLPVRNLSVFGGTCCLLSALKMVAADTSKICTSSHGINIPENSKAYRFFLNIHISLFCKICVLALLLTFV